MGKMKGNQGTPYVDYHLSFHLGFCTGPVDSLQAIFMKEKVVHDEEMFGGDKIYVDKPELFGGHQREGGVKGDIHFRDGSFSQLVPTAFAERVGLDVDDCPAFRGIASLYFLGPEPGVGFKVSSNYPNVPPVAARLTRASWPLGGGKEIIEHVTEDTVYYNSNPAHIIYECLVDKIWGMGGSPALIDTASFRACADTLYEENFGLSMKWVRSSTIEAFIQEVLDHINALFFFNPRTGLATLKLLRNDYDIDTLREIGPSNSRLITFRRKLWGETANEIVVTWTNPSNEQEETVTYQSLGNIAMQGEVVSEGRNYYGVRSAELAAEICARDIVSASYPLAMATLEVDRNQWDILPGDVLKFSWPVEGYNIGMILMRVMDIDYGNPKDSKIRLELLEDVFGLDKAEFLPPPRSEWEDPDQDPDDEPFANLDLKFAAAPYPVIQSLPAALYEPSDDDYPVIVVAIMASIPEGGHDLQKIIVWKKTYLPNGSETFTSIGERNLTNKAVLSNSIPAEAVSTVSFHSFTGGADGPVVSGFALIGDLDEFGAELVMLDADLGSGQWRIDRGIIDTVPHAWPAGTPVWFLGPDFYAFDWSEPLAYEVLDYRIQPRTSKGVRDFNNVTVTYTEHPARHYFPFRPANFKVDGVAFGESDSSEDHNPRNWTIMTTWSNRHRKTEDGIIRRWQEETTAPEPGQTTFLQFGGAEVRGLEGTSFALPVEWTGQLTTLDIRGMSERDGFDSLQGHVVRKKLYPKGYGNDYGYFFGGWPATPGEP